MATRPVLGIICCNRIVGTEPAQAVMERYVREAMLWADTAALLIPSLPDLMAVTEVVPRLDGVLLTGSPSNIEAARYGDDAGEGPYDAARDETALRLIDAMAAARKPVFGICRGFQEINVALGGTLRRDTATNPEFLPHHAPDDVSFDAMFDHRHIVRCTHGGILERAFARDLVEVNSVHYQGVAMLAPSLTVEAEAEDGLVEAFSMDLNGAPLLAVQWHPEWNTQSDPDSQTYFRLLGKALRGEPL